MTIQIAQRASAVITALLAAGLALSAPALADSPSGNSTTVEMQMPGPSRALGPYAPPLTSLSAQQGGGVDRDGVQGYVDPDGTNGSMTGPSMRAVPVIRAKPAPRSPRDKS